MEYTRRWIVLDCYNHKFQKIVVALSDPCHNQWRLVLDIRKSTNTPSQSTKKNYGGHKNYGDATRIQPNSLPKFDLLVGGFPCQAFSIAGKRRGLNDTRGTLFFEIARILKEKRPTYCVLENVKGLLSHDHGRTFKIVISTIAELGYDVEWQVLNSKNYGVPQNRERVFIIGYLGGERRFKVFPISLLGREASEVSGEIQEVQCASTLRQRDYKDGYQNLIKRVAHMEGFRRYNQTYDPSGHVEALDTAGGGGHQPCITESSTVRRLTPVECERLQGFPDNYTKYGILDGKVVNISDTQRYKCLGNAVTTNVVYAIIKRLFYFLDDSTTGETQL